MRRSKSRPRTICTGSARRRTSTRCSSCRTAACASSCRDCRAAARVGHGRAPVSARPRQGGRRYRARGRSTRDRRAAAEHQNQFPARRLAVAAAVRRSAGAGDEHHRAGPARRLHRVEPGDAQHGRQTGSARNGRRARAPRPAEPAAHQGSRSARAWLEDSVAGAVGGREEPARVLPARADEGDSERARRRGRSDQGNRRAARKDRGRGHARGREEGSQARARSPVEDAGRGGRVHRVAHLCRLAHRAALVEAHRRSDRSGAHEGGARRRSLGAREGQRPHSRIPRGAQAQPDDEGTDPVLRRTSGSRQDVAREVDRQLARSQVRSRVARRHARRGGDPRASPHLHRRAAGPGHSGAAPRRVEEPGVHPRRDRQARLRFPRRPELGAARGARSGAEQHVPRSLPRRAVRSVGGPVRDDGERARHDSAAAARQNGSARAARLYRRREAQDRDRSISSRSRSPITA